MYIVETSTKTKYDVSVLPVVNEDFKQITVKRYSFKWKQLKDECDIYKLTLNGDNDILGLVALVDHAAEERTEIRLLTSSVENRGVNKKYDRIAGCLIAFACREALRKFKNFPAISLVPKTELKGHYIEKYGMEDGGRQLYVEGMGLYRIMKEYLL